MSSEVKASYQSPEVINGTLDWVDAHLADLDVYLDELPADMACAGMAIIPNDPIFKRYKSGGALLKFDFVVMVLVPKSDTAAKLDALKVLSGLGDDLMGGDWPVLGDNAAAIKAELITNARNIGADDAGNDRYEAVYRLYYKTN